MKGLMARDTAKLWSLFSFVLYSPSTTPPKPPRHLSLYEISRELGYILQQLVRWNINMFLIEYRCQVVPKTV